jgi:hypothetical protein
MNDALQIISVALAVLGNVTLVKKLRATFILWAVANVTQGIVELSAHLYWLFALQVFFLVMNAICWVKWGKGK